MRLILSMKKRAKRLNPQQQLKNLRVQLFDRQLPYFKQVKNLFQKVNQESGLQWCFFFTFFSINLKRAKKISAYVKKNIGKSKKKIGLQMQDWSSFFIVILVETICLKLSYHAKISETNSLFFVLKV